VVAAVAPVAAAVTVVVAAAADAIDRGRLLRRHNQGAQNWAP